MSDSGATLPPPTTSQSSEAKEVKVWWKRWWVIAIGVVLAIGVVGAIAGGGEDDSAEDATPGTDATTITEAPGETEPSEPAESPEDTTSATDPVETEPPVATDPPSSGDSVAGAPVGERGDRANPVPLGSIADIGEGYRLQVLSVTDDATALVMAENQFNDPPAEGTRFTIVEVALGFYGFEDPQSGFSLQLSAVGSSNTELDSSCGVTPNELNQYEDMFGGSVTRGNLCFVTTPADTGVVQLYATVGFTGPDVFLDASSTPTALADMPALPGIQPGTASADQRTSPTPVGTGADVGDGWSLTVTGPAADITDAVLAENQFNDPPPEGFRFVGVPVRLDYGGEGSSSPFTVTIKAVGNSNLQYSTQCGVTPGELDSFGDVFTGGGIEGQECFVVPAADLGSVVLYAGTLLEDYVFFATQ